MKKVVWLLVSCLMVLSLVIASCGPGGEVEEEEEVEGLRSPTEPKYGGTITAVGWDLGPIDPTTAQAIRVGHMQLTSNELLQGDWAKGPQGTGETLWEWGFLGDVTLEVGELAESWEMPDDETIIYNIRKDAYYHDKPPANGRQVTAEDVVWNIHYQFNYPGCWQTMTYPPNEAAKVADRMLPGSPLRPTSVKALDNYTVEVKVPAESQGIIFLEIGDNLYTNPPECWEEEDGWQTWDEVIGSGPFMLTDYVSGSSLTYTKFDNYYEEDPLHPGNKWPYIDTLKFLVIPDVSSQLAALRTGGTDLAARIGFEDALDMMERCPDLQYSKLLGTPYVAAGRMDKPELPFHDLKVRQALNLAVDQQEILDDYLKGQGVLLGYPYHPTPSYEKYYTALEDMPEEVQMLFEYDVERAKELLTEAGYPNGFTTHIITTAGQSDEVSMLKAYLSDIDVDLEIEVVEVGAWNGIDAANSHEEMFYGIAKGCWAPFEMLQTKKGVYSNYAIIDDPYYDHVQEVIGKDMVKNPDNYFETMKEAGVYELASAWGIWMPNRYSYVMWWPWVQNYFGIVWSGWANISDWYKGIWIDEEMKESMGY